MNGSLPMTRARLYVLVESFETDIRHLLNKYVVSEVGDAKTFGDLYAVCISRRDSEGNGEELALENFLHLGEGYDLLNAHRGKLPQELAIEVREQTANLGELIGIRNRVMHARPLLAGDSDTALSILDAFKTGYWPELRRTLAQLRADTTWEPANLNTTDISSILHNLPLPDYDDTGLVGRSLEVQEVVGLLKRGREPVITITGEGGIGKTALAIDVAYRIVDDKNSPFEAVLWSSLKYEKLTAFGIKEISGAARDLIGALQPAGKSIDVGFSGSISELSDVLDGVRVLVVIDNLETVSGDEFRSLYNALPDSVSYLITSRIGVGEYERRYSLEALRDKDSLHLFNQFVRARRIKTLSALSNDARVEVVRRLRFSPLAIKWFALAVEAGKNPHELVNQQDELLEFCVRSVYDELGARAKEVLTALAVLSRPLSPDELVVLLDQASDTVATALQELIRGSLVRRESVGTPSDLMFQIVLTETATEFLGRRVEPDESLKRQLESREREFREVQERRATDIAARALAPVVVRQRSDADVPTCMILRKALLLAHRGADSSQVYDLVDRARRMNPDFWEVDRVDGFVRDSFGDLATATACYERAYERARGEDRAVVAHFFAGHLARKLHDVNRALRYSREAHELLDVADTGAALGNYLVWTHSFDEGIGYLEIAVQRSLGRSRIIAISALADAWRRFAESVGDRDRNPLQQFDHAIRGFAISVAAIESGIADDRLRSTAAACATVALNGASVCLRSGMRVSSLASFVERLETTLVRFVGTRSWNSLKESVESLANLRGSPTAANRLRESLRSLDSSTGTPAHGDPLPRSLVGETVNVSATFGFIRHPMFPENLFFHAGSVSEIGGISSLANGMLVRFSPSYDDSGRARAYDVHEARSAAARG